jgi:hypothetical protein
MGSQLTGWWWDAPYPPELQPPLQQPGSGDTRRVPRAPHPAAGGVARTGCGCAQLGWWRDAADRPQPALRVPLGSTRAPPRRGPAVGQTTAQRDALDTPGAALGDPAALRHPRPRGGCLDAAPALLPRWMHPRKARGHARARASTRGGRCDERRPRTLGERRQVPKPCSAPPWADPHPAAQPRQTPRLRAQRAPSAPSAG